MPQGVYVVGPNNLDGRLEKWAFPTVEYASHFAKQLSADTGEEVLILQPIGMWRPKSPPLEYIPMADPSPRPAE